MNQGAVTTFWSALSRSRLNGLMRPSETVPIRAASHSWLSRKWDCTLSQNATAAANVIVNENVALTIAAGVGLDIDLSTFLLTVKNGATVVIKSGGKVF